MIKFNELVKKHYARGGVCVKELLKCSKLAPPFRCAFHLLKGFVKGLYCWLIMLMFVAVIFLDLFSKDCFL